jgi:tetratricopeptide (TPR) repeat protein
MATDIIFHTMASEAGRKFSMTSGLQRYFANASFKRGFPIPRESTPYAFAKAAEYIEKNLEKAEHFYRQAIEIGERPESAIKDLAGLLHQQGKTQEACDLLQEHKHIFVADLNKYENLLKNLQKQMTPSKNTLNKAVKITGLGPLADELTLKGFFDNPNRILHIELGFTDKVKWAIVRFSSHSAARKTFEGFRAFHRYRLEWMSITGEIVEELTSDKVEGFSLFSLGNSSQSRSVSEFYTYLPESPRKKIEDPIDQVLENSLFSYLRHHN